MNFFEKILYKKISIWIWLISIFSFLLISLVLLWSLYYVFTADYPNGFKYKLGKNVRNVAEFTDNSLRLIDDFTSTIDSRKIKFDKFRSFKIYDNNFIDNGYLLFSSIDINSNPSTFLYDLSLKKIIYVWSWPINEILEKTSIQKKITKCCFRAQHPLILDDGSLISNSSQGPLVKIDKYSKIKWVLDKHTHHSISLDSNKNIIVPSVVDSRPDRIFLPTRDDGYIKVSPSGKIIEETSIRDILEKNKYYGLLYGIGDFKDDLIHLNDAEPILTSDQFVKKDDLMFSSRNLSTVFLYRPSTEKIIWLKNGPWLKQHDVDYNGNGKFSVFDNGVIDSYTNIIKENIPENRIKNNQNSIKEFDMKDNKITEKFSLTKNNKIFTSAEGLHRILKNKDVFVEETQEGILHRISKNGNLRWSFVNRLDKNYIGSLHWSRYYHQEELNLDWLNK
ncbi:arylsulfotransferase family protein [Pelagibacteraceae bacterium]|nr:arylsulfotransferase family protein [Pelagibacteraceae bacterium]